MRASLEHLIKDTIVFQYDLPNHSKDISKAHISLDNDRCYSSKGNNELASIIYNAILDYAFDEHGIAGQDFQTLHRRALTSKLKYKKDAHEDQQLKYGFYGEVILYCILYIFYEAPPAIARGYFYNILENGETKGYDAYHLVENDGQIELWFGEVKFYKDFPSATTGANGAITNLEKAISDNYLNKNLIAVSENLDRIKSTNAIFNDLLTDIQKNPEITILNLSRFYNIKLVYPVLILFDEHKSGYDETIKAAIKHIEDKVKHKILNISVEVSLFFIIVPVESSKDIKLKVIEWIRNNEPLMS